MIVTVQNDDFKRWKWLDRLQMWENQEKEFEKLTSPEMDIMLQERFEFHHVEVGSIYFYERSKR